MMARIGFLWNETWQALRRNPLLQVASISTACVALILVGVVGMTLYKLDAVAQMLPKQFETEVFLKLSATREQALALKEKISAMPEVARVVLIPREQAWEEEKARLADEINLKDLPNPLPDKLIVATHDPEQLPAVAERIRQEPTVDEVIDQRETLRQVLATARLVRMVGLSAISLLLLSAILLIYNTVRLTIYSRQREVRVMALVGASLFTMRIPFILEGMIQGGLGGLIGAGLVLLGAGLISDYTLQLWPFLRDLPPGLPPTLLLISLPTLGALIGGLCAWWAVQRFVRV